MSFKFEVGDKVKVVDSGQLYDSYEDFGIEYMGWVKGRHPKRKTKYTVIGQHRDDYSNIYAIGNASGQVYLYGEKGLELIPEKKVLSSSSPEPFKFPTWIQKPYGGADKTGLVIDLRKHGNSNQPACWLSADRKSWQCNQSFKSNLTPVEASMMLLALEEIHENSPC